MRRSSRALHPGRLGIPALACAAAVALGCNKPATSNCASADDCEPGWLCIDDACRKVCATDRDCPIDAPACRDGFCQEAPPGDCARDSDCVTPGRCRTLRGAVCNQNVCYYNTLPQGYPCDDQDACTVSDTCGSGTCQGTAVQCNTPPAPQCVSGNTVYRGFPSVGACTPADGGCVYTAVDIACPGCDTNCLGRCDAVTCPDREGGCQSLGICDPSTLQCTYTTRANATPCDLTGQPTGSHSGVCSSGSCVECLGPGDCHNPPGGLVNCYAASCDSNACHYSAIAGPGCPSSQCADKDPGTTCDDDNPCSFADHCNNDHLCVGTDVVCVDGTPPCGPTRACNGTANCTVTYPGTSTACDDANDCTWGDHCSGGGQCVPTGSITCTSVGGACGTQRTCNGTAACDEVTPAPGSSCDDGDDCTYGDHCTGGGACVPNGSVTCTSGTGTCAMQRSCNGTATCDEWAPGSSVSCDDGNPCTCNDVCNGSGGCGGSTLICTNDGGTCGATRTCNGSCACSVSYPSGTDCGICMSCNGAGGCSPNSTDHGDCGFCMKCSAGSCVPATGENPKSECPNFDCAGTSCLADGTCGYQPYQAPCSTCYSGSNCWCDGGSTCTSSCPFIFARRHGGWEYVTDDAGNATGMPLKHALRSGLPQYFSPRYIILGELDRDIDELYRVKIREPLHELDFVDELTLVAIDHPVGTEVVSSSAQNRIEDRRIYPIEVITVREPQLPIAATDWLERDILDAVSEKDGWGAPSDASPRYYTFDFGPILDTRDTKLVLDAWGMFGERFVTGEPQVRSHLLVVDAQGEWVRVKEIGYPAGDEKRMAIALDGIFLSDDHRIRVQTGTGPGGMMRWTIDRAMLDTSAPETTVVHELTAVYASLGHKGGIDYTPAGHTNRFIVDDGRIGTSAVHLGFGEFTRLGAVTELVTKKDDEFVVMQHGDELVAAFADDTAPPAGMVRTWAVKTALIYKQHYRDRRVGPMPFWGMTSDPPAPGEHYPRDAAHRAYLATYNTRRYLEYGRRDPLGDRDEPLRLGLGDVANDSPVPIELAAVATSLRSDLARRGASVTLVEGAPKEVEAVLAGVITGVGQRCSVTLALTEAATGNTMTAATVDARCSPQEIDRAVHEAFTRLSDVPARLYAGSAPLCPPR